MSLRLEWGLFIVNQKKVAIGSLLQYKSLVSEGLAGRLGWTENLVNFPSDDDREEYPFLTFMMVG